MQNIFINILKLKFKLEQIQSKMASFKNIMYSKNDAP